MRLWLLLNKAELERPALATADSSAGASRDGVRLAAMRHGRPSVSPALRRAAMNVAAVVLAAAWIAVVADLLVIRGFFNWIGTDWAMYWGATRLFLASGPAAAYDVSRLPDAMRPLMAYYGPHIHQQVVGPTPYPPVFFLLFAPETWLPPLTGFGLWTALNVALGAWVVLALTARAGMRRWGVVLSLLLSFPFAYGIFVGQPVGLLLFSFWRGYVALERRQDLRAGMWIGCLVSKPQFLPVFALLFLLKRRWHALGGLALTTGAVVVASVGAFGIQWIRALYRLLGGSYTGVELVQATVWPQHMMSWRGFLVDVAPGLGETAAISAIAALSLLTLSLLPLIWRGEWNPSDGRFGERMLATLIVTFLVAYHSHIHGAVLALVPGVLLYAAPGGSKFVRSVLLLNVFSSSLIFCATVWVPTVAVILVPQMLVVLGILAWRQRGDDAGASGPVAAALVEVP